MNRPSHLSVIVLFMDLAVSCTDESKRVCEPPTVYPVDADQKCMREAVEADGLQACRSSTEKGEAYECVVSPGGELYVAGRDVAASFQSSAWRYGDELSLGEQRLCAEVSGPPYPGVLCE